MRKLVACLSLFLSMNLFSAETKGHEVMRAVLAMSENTSCNLDLGEAKILSRNPKIVSYTYVLTVNDQSESISFDQDRQLFTYTSDQKNFETLSNINGTNLSGIPKIFNIKINARGKLVEVRIGNIVCKE